VTNAEPGPVSLAAVGRSTFVLAGAAAIVQAIGFARQLFLAAEVGISSGLDALLIAIAAPLALAGIATAGVRVAMVPAYLDAKAELGSSDAKRLAGAALVWTGAVGVVLSLILWVLAEAIVAITGPGLAEAGTAADSVRYLRSLAALGLLLPLASIFYALCQAESLFPAIAVAQVVGPLLTLGIMVTAWDSMGLDSLVAGTLVGEVASLAIVAAATIISRVAPTPNLMPRGLGLMRMLRHAVPLSTSAAILEISRVFDRAIASWLAVGGVSALRYGDSIVRVPFAAIRPAWAQAVYPALVRARRSADPTGMAGMTDRMLRYAIAFFVPLAALTVAVAPVAVATAYGRGAFSSEDVLLTATIVAVSAPLIVMWTVSPTLVAALNARRMGRTMLAASVVNVVLNLVFNVVFGILFGVAGVALATTLSTALVVAFFAWSLARAEPSFAPRSLNRTFTKSLLAILPSALLFGIPIWAGAFGGGTVEGLVLLVVIGVAGLTSYYALARRLGLREVAEIAAFGMDSLRRLAARLGIGS
jgi:putative peptidoglycan lipid II flippase